MIFIDFPSYKLHLSRGCSNKNHIFSYDVPGRFPSWTCSRATQQASHRGRLCLAEFSQARASHHVSPVVNWGLCLFHPFPPHIIYIYIHIYIAYVYIYIHIAYSICIYINTVNHTYIYIYIYIIIHLYVYRMHICVYIYILYYTYTTLVCVYNI